MRVVPLIAAVAAVGVLSGCADLIPSGPIRLWALPETAEVRRDAAPERENEVFSETDRLIRLDAAVNETASFQLLLKSFAAARIESVILEELRRGEQSIGPEQIELYRQLPCPVSEHPAWYLRLTPQLREPAEVFDLLVPLGAPAGALPILLDGERVEAIWGDIHVPAGTEAGAYRGLLRVTPSRGPAMVLGVTLTVWPFALPQTRHLDVMAGLDVTRLLSRHLQAEARPYTPSQLRFEDPSYAQAAAVLDATVHLLHDHRCSPMLRDVHPLRKTNPANQLELDWSDYDRLVAGLIDGTAFEDRAAARMWPLPVNEREPAPEAFGGRRSPTYRRILGEYLKQCLAHFADRDWLGRHYVWFAMPADGLPAQYREFDRLARLLLDADQRAKLVTTLPPQPMKPYGLLDDGYLDLTRNVSVWSPPASLMDTDELARRRATGSRVWMWPDQPPYAGSLSAIAPPVHARSLPWVAYRFKLDGLMLPVVNDWPEGAEPSSSGSERQLIWAGNAYGLDRAVPSVRLKRLRRGMQDYEYLWLLERNGRPGIANLIASDLVAYAGTGAYGDHCLDGRAHGWNEDAVSWSVARRLMARELVSAMEPAPGQSGAGAEDVGLFDRQLEWARLTQSTRKVRMDVEGARVQIDEQATPPIRVDLSLNVFNATRAPLGGELTLRNLPPGWKLDAPAPTIGRLEPAHRTQRVLRVSAPLIAANPDGVFALEPAIAEGGVIKTSAPGRVCVLTSQRLTRPLTMDGRLNDWPLGSVNVAGDFILVGALDVPKQSRASVDRPMLGTVVFVCHDDEAIYVAFNCDEPLLSERRMTRGNAVQYDELWPTGEDVLEIVIDPSGRAVDPGDLLHIVVKANGAVITERGVPCLARVARYESWPANVTAAIDDTSQQDRWTVEIRIPLASLPQRGSILGMNFGRYQARLGEYASWSGARRYLYSPASLGNVRVP